MVKKLKTIRLPSGERITIGPTSSPAEAVRRMLSKTGTTATDRNKSRAAKKRTTAASMKAYADFAKAGRNTRAAQTKFTGAGSKGSPNKKKKMSLRNKIKSKMSSLKFSAKIGTNKAGYKMTSARKAALAKARSIWSRMRGGKKKTKTKVGKVA